MPNTSKWKSARLTIAIPDLLENLFVGGQGASERSIELGWHRVHAIDRTGSKQSAACRSEVHRRREI